MIVPGEIHVWTVALDDRAADAARADAALLDEVELAARDRLRLAGHRTEYERRHGALRRALSWCAPTVAPGEWRFTRVGRGRPEVVAPLAACRLRFNLSHTPGWAAIAVTVDAACGVDIEDDRRPLNVRDVARIALGDREQQELQRLSPQQWHGEVLRRWTVKEAYLKGRGVGLDVPLRAIGTATTTDGPGIEAGPHAPDAGLWQLHQWTDEDHLLVTVAIRTSPGHTSTLHRHRDQLGGGTASTATSTLEGLRPCIT